MTVNPVDRVAPCTTHRTLAAIPYAIALAIGTATTCLAPVRAEQPAVTNKAASHRPLDVAALATQWMDAVRNGDLRAVMDITGHPFALRETLTEGFCMSATMPHGMRTAFMLQCLTQDPMLMEELKANPELSTEVLAKKQLPAWAKPWHHELRPGLTPVQMTLFGNGVVVYFVLLIGNLDDGPGVYGLWKHAVFDPT